MVEYPLYMWVHICRYNALIEEKSRCESSLFIANLSLGVLSSDMKLIWYLLSA